MLALARRHHRAVGQHDVGFEQLSIVRPWLRVR